LGTIEVLRLVHEQDGRPGTPSSEQRRMVAQDPDGAGHQVVHVDRPVGRQRGSIRGIGRMQLRPFRAGSTLGIEGQPGEHVVEEAHRRRRQWTPGQSLDDRRPLREP